jgi:hypothetical protein
MTDIQFFDTVFDEQFCTYLLANARAWLKDGGEITRSNFHWDEAIRKGSAAVLVRDFGTVHSTLVLDKLIERGLIEHRDYNVMNYAWTRLSYIPWHDDNESPDALTIYLNDVWKLDWGGLFLYKDEAGEVRGYPPTFNCGLRNGDHVSHATTPVSLDAPEPRFTLQLFRRGGARPGNFCNDRIGRENRRTPLGRRGTTSARL